MSRVGRAYGFFDCDATKGEIEELMPIIRDYAQIPANLKHYLVEGTDNVDNVPHAIKKFAEKHDFRYTLKAEISGKTNKFTANEVGCILNQTYQSPLFNEGDDFSGEVVYLNWIGFLRKLK